MNNITTIAHQAIQIDNSVRETMDISSYAAGAGLRKLVDGEFNIPGAISLIVIVGVVVFMYWAIKYR